MADPIDFYRFGMWVSTIVALFCGFGCWAAWEEGFSAGKRRAIRDRGGIDRAGFIKALTKHLDIEADGGDSPEAFVQWAVKQAIKESSQ